MLQKLKLGWMWGSLLKALNYIYQSKLFLKDMTAALLVEAWKLLSNNPLSLKAND